MLLRDRDISWLEFDERRPVEAEDEVKSGSTGNDIPTRTNSTAPKTAAQRPMQFPTSKQLRQDDE